MTTPFNIDDRVTQRQREEAARRGTTMPVLAEAGLGRVLGEDTRIDDEREPLPPLPAWTSGGLRVDIADCEALHRKMDEA
ncbi:MAG: hypothetical protein OXH11_15275 [Candidatus Aminicenantes bacterium]|nr:hypothetical protein [Candidatus Aminicenantes bacterium]